AVLGAHVTAAFADYASTGAHLKTGKLLPLATASRSRIEFLPAVPTIAESGYPDNEAEVWFGLVAPAKTPANVISELATRITAALRTPEVRSSLEALGLSAVGICGPEFAAHIQSKYHEYGRIIREANIKAD